LSHASARASIRRASSRETDYDRASGRSRTEFGGRMAVAAPAKILWRIKTILWLKKASLDRTTLLLS
jgi:hypothetical protein